MFDSFKWEVHTLEEIRDKLESIGIDNERMSIMGNVISFKDSWHIDIVLHITVNYNNNQRKTFEVIDVDYEFIA